MKSSSRQGKLTLLAALVMAGSVLTGCKDDAESGPAAAEANAYVRYVNSTFQEQPPGTPTMTTSTNSAGVTTTVIQTPIEYTAMAVDVLIDSSASEPSLISMPPNSVSAGNAGPEPAMVSTGGFRDVPRGVRSFVARKSGMTPKAGYSFFTTSKPSQYLPKLHLLSKTPYTLALVGTNISPADTGQRLNPEANIPFTMIRDDPFYPPTMEIDGKPTKQARLRLYNMGRFFTATGGTNSIQLYLTPGNTPPTNLPALVQLGGSASVRGATAYVNVDPGEYYITVATGFGATRTSLAGKVVSLKSGEIRSFFLLHDMTSYIITTTQTITTQPSGSSSTRTTFSAPPAAFKIVDVVDNVW